MAKRRRQRLDFFEELEALDTGFFHDLDEMLRVQALQLEAERLEKIRRAENAEKARRIYPRLKAVEMFDCWHATRHIVPDFFGSNKERVRATKALYEKRERLRWFLRALYNYWMFDIPMPWATKWMGLRYSRHRKHFRIILREHKRNARKQKHVTRAEIREQKKADATKALDALKTSVHFEKLRASKDDDG